MTNEEKKVRKKRRSKRQNRRFLLVAIITFILVFGVVYGAVYTYFRYMNNKPDTQQENTHTDIAQQDQTDTPQQEQIDTEQPNNSVYGKLYTYESENKSRYEAYAAKYDYLSDEDVVWQVNANLDCEYYTNDIEVSTYDDPFIVVNKFYKVPQDYKPTDLVTVEGYSMRSSVQPAYEQMKQQAANDGITLYIKSAYRSYEKQKSLYSSYSASDGVAAADKYSARAGYSEHQTGLALDITDRPDQKLSNISDTLAQWFADNAYKYGFIVRYTTYNQWVTGYQAEPWHLRYVGVQAALEIKEKGITSLEEYKGKFIDHKES